MEGAVQVKLFVSFVIEDKLWANQIISFLQDNGFTIEIECLTKEHLYGSNYNSLDENKQYIHVVIVSQDYLKHEKRLKTFCEVNDDGEDKKQTMVNLLNRRPVVCIHIDRSELPNFVCKRKSVKLLRWQPDSELLFWKQFGKLSKSLRQKILIRNALNKEKCSSQKNDKKQEFMEIDDSESEEEEDTAADISKDFSYESYDKVFPHLLSESFSAEDIDLSKSDIDDLTMKVEDIEAMLSIDLTTGAPTGNSLIEFPKSDLLSHLEQMDVLDLLHTVRHRICEKIERSENDLFRRKIYRRILKRYDVCIKSVLNGEKNKIDITSLPLLNMVAKKEDETHFSRCCCCDALFHSERALQIHFEGCVKESWKAIMKSK